MKLWQLTAYDLAVRCHTSTTLDINTVKRRFENEGDSFFTITLPSFGSDFEKSLDYGYVDHDSFPGFARTKGLPRFLGGFLDLVFERGTGRLHEEPSIEAIFAIRQTRLYSKLFLMCSEERQRKAIEMYLMCEEELKRAEELWGLKEMDEKSPISSDYGLKDLAAMSNTLFRDALLRLDEAIFAGDVIPKHGPGKTADRISGNQKYKIRSWPRRLEEVFPMREHVIPNDILYSEYLDQVELLEPGAEIPSRVTLVPKTMKTARIIAIEPTSLQYMQQAVAERFAYELCEKNGKKKSLFSRFVDFRDQGPNQVLAKVGSTDQSLATLDLSEASDRVSNMLIKELFANHPQLLGALQATRSQKASIPGHGILPLTKFASMGSATCFPIETYVFLCIIFVGIQKSLNRRLTKKDILSFEGQVQVFGDDIIVPVDHVSSVISALEAYGFKVNASKSFWTGKFRESCGKEYYAGHDVSIVKVRQKFPTSRNDVTELISWVSTRNQLYEMGLWGPVKWLDEVLGKLIPLPRIEPTSSVIGRLSYLGHDVHAADPDTHGPLIKGYVIRDTPPTSPLDDHHALLKFFLKRGYEPFFDPKHLERQGRPAYVGIKMRWAQPY